jgi:hypothetical protein
VDLKSRRLAFQRKQRQGVIKSFEASKSRVDLNRWLRRTCGKNIRRGLENQHYEESHGVESKSSESPRSQSKSRAVD